MESANRGRGVTLRRGLIADRAAAVRAVVVHQKEPNPIRTRLHQDGLRSATEKGIRIVDWNDYR